MSFVKFIAAVILLFLIASFGVKNMQPLTLAYFFGDHSVQLPTFFALLFAVLVGAVLSCAFFGLRHLRLLRQTKHLERQVRDLQEELARAAAAVPATPSAAKQPQEATPSPLMPAAETRADHTTTVQALGNRDG